MSRLWCLYAGSAQELDLFPAHPQRKPSGDVIVVGGEKRAVYVAAELLVVVSGLDDVREAVRHYEAAIRNLPRSDDIKFTIQRDQIEMDARNALHSVCKRNCKPLVEHIRERGV